MNELRLTIVFAFVTLFWAWALTIYTAYQGSWIMSAVLATCLVPVTLIFCERVKEDWNY